MAVYDRWHRTYPPDGAEKGREHPKLVPSAVHRQGKWWRSGGVMAGPPAQASVPEEGAGRLVRREAEARHDRGMAVDITASRSRSR